MKQQKISIRYSMALKVKEFIEWLKTQDQEAIVKVVAFRAGLGHFDAGGSAFAVNFDHKKHVDYTTFTTFPNTLLLGEL
jgi:hypothetical protein